MHAALRERLLLILADELVQLEGRGGEYHRPENVEQQLRERRLDDFLLGQVDDELVLQPLLLLVSQHGLQYERVNDLYGLWLAKLLHLRLALRLPFERMRVRLLVVEKRQRLYIHQHRVDVVRVMLLLLRDVALRETPEDRRVWLHELVAQQDRSEGVRDPRAQVIQLLVILVYCLHPRRNGNLALREQLQQTAKGPGDRLLLESFRPQNCLHEFQR